MGKSAGDPFDLWWQENSKKLRVEGTTEEWHYAAYKLAEELSKWRETIDSLDKEVILLDRSLISRASFVLDREPGPFSILEINDLYPIQPEKELELEDVLPDIIFELTAPKNILLSRLDPNDPKYDFRAKIIENNYDNFSRARTLLSPIIQERIIQIDSSRPIDQVFDDILEELNNKLTLFKK